MTRDGRALAAFHDEYRRCFPSGGDAQDHDEAIESAVAAAVDVTVQEIVGRIREKGEYACAGFEDDVAEFIEHEFAPGVAS